LTAKERVLLTFQRKETDRVPIYGEARNVGFIEAVTGKKLRGATKEVMEHITAEAYGKVGMDMLRSMMTPQWGVVEGVQCDGYLRWTVGGAEQAHTLDEARESLKRFADSGDDPRDAAHAHIREVERLQAILGDRTLFVPSAPVSCLEHLYHGIGIENFSTIMFEDGELIDAALERNMERASQMVEVINNMNDSPVIHCADDLGMKNTTILSPEWMREHAFSRIKRVVDKIKNGGKYFLFHSCGNVNKIVPDLISLGVDALEPIEPTAGMSLAEMKRNYGDKLVLLGNVNANILQMGSPEDVRAEVRRCFDDAAHGGGYFLNGAITQVSPVENVMAYFDEAGKYVG